MSSRSSRLPELRRASSSKRRHLIESAAGLSRQASATLEQPASFGIERAEAMIENAIGVYGLPLGIATNFIVNGREVLIPMVIEEPSVIAGASWAAKAARELGGFTATSTERRMIGQVHLLGISDELGAIARVETAGAEVLDACARLCPRMVARGGGPRELRCRALGDGMIVVHVVIDTLDAMGANSVNAVCEGVSPMLEHLTGGRAILRILSNYTDECLATATVEIPVASLDKRANDGSDERIPGGAVLDGILLAQKVAELDVYRAVTHNKGVMNGVDAVVIATGNDWRAVEAASHAHACRSGRYGPLTKWSKTERGLRGELELPMAIGTVGGTIPLHPVAQAALEILGVGSARELAEVCVAVGLAQNLAALRALVSFGIQASHMGLHARSVAAAAGARGPTVDRVAEALMSIGDIRIERAQALMSLLPHEEELS